MASKWRLTCVFGPCAPLLTEVSAPPAAYPMSEDHKPNRADERQRIEEAGGVVVWAGTWRVGGVLAGAPALWLPML
jgi:protein phosphatase 1L